VAPVQLVGIIMVDRPTVADPAWLSDIERTFGGYQLVPMTQSGERGLVCQIQVAGDSGAEPLIDKVEAVISRGRAGDEKQQGYSYESLQYGPSAWGYHLKRLSHSMRVFHTSL
jgi:hypothetical protein